MTSRGSLQGVGCGSPKRAVVVGWGWGLMRENSQQVTPSLYLGVLSQRLDLPLPGWQRGALAHKSRGRPSGSRSATQKGACRATLLCVLKPHLLPRQCPLLAPDPPRPPPPAAAPGGRKVWLALPRVPETGRRAVLSCHIQPTPISSQPATAGEAVSPPEQPHWPRPSSGVHSHPSPQNEKDMLSIRSAFFC